MRFAVLLFAGLLVAAGCDSNPRRQISGTIKLSNVLLDDGVIEFLPIAGTTAEGVPATMGGSIITDGKYLIRGECGLVPAKYKVLITSGDGRDPENPDAPPGPSGNFVSKDRIPPEYNERSKVEVQVANEGDNIFDFDIP